MLIRLVIKKANSIVTELFISGRKLEIFLTFIAQLCLKLPKHVRLSTIHFFIMKIRNKKTSTNCV